MRRNRRSVPTIWRRRFFTDWGFGSIRKCATRKAGRNRCARGNRCWDCSNESSRQTINSDSFAILNRDFQPNFAVLLGANHNRLMHGYRFPKAHAGHAPRFRIAIVPRFAPAWQPTDDFIAAGRDQGQSETAIGVGKRVRWMLVHEQESAHPVIARTAG